MTGVSSFGEPLVIASLTPTTTYVALCTADPGNTATLTSNPPEVPTAGTAYARQSLTAGGVTNTGNNPTVGSNTAVLTWAQATAAYGTVSYFALMNSLSATTSLLGSGALTTAKAVNTGDTARFAIGALTITVN